MRRADRLFEIIQLLSNGQLITAQTLASHFEIHVRTIYRDINALVIAGVPIDGAAGLGYLLRPGYSVPPLMFTPAEVLALVSGSRMIGTFGGAEMAQNAQSALDKLQLALPVPLRKTAQNTPIHAMNFRNLSQDTRRIIDDLITAILRQNQVEIQYSSLDDHETIRVIRPLGQWYWGSVWTLVAWCELRQAFRSFRIDRITDYKVLKPFRHETGKTLQDFLKQVKTCEGAPQAPFPS